VKQVQQVGGKDNSNPLGPGFSIDFLLKFQNERFLFKNAHSF
jgi:hypothetical protein